MKYFDKYQNLGAYHWDWYKTNKFEYKDQVDYTLSKLPSNGTLLDVGCGDGLTSFKAFKKGLDVTGIDLNELAIKYAKEKTSLYKDVLVSGRLNFKSQSVYDIEGENIYDYALLHDVIEHLEQPKIAIEKVFNATRNFCIISTPNAEYCSPNEYDNKFWSPDGIFGLLGGIEGLKIEILRRDQIIYILIYKGERPLLQETQKIKDNQKKKVLVTVPNTGYIHKKCVEALLRLQTGTKGHSLNFNFPVHNPYENNLHHIVKDFIKKDYDFWLSFDSDNPPMNNPLDLISLDKDIIGLPTPVWHYKGDIQGERPLYYNGYDFVDDKNAYMEHLPREGLQRVDAIGTGCFIIARRVFEIEEMRESPFERILNNDGTVHKGNDISFCLLPGQTIYGNDMKMIEDIQINDFVASANPNSCLTKVVHKFEREYQGKIIKIQPYYYDACILTPNHKILVRRSVPRGDKQLLRNTFGEKKDIEVNPVKTITSWIKSSEVKEGDWVKVSKFVRRGRAKKQINISDYLDTGLYSIQGEYISLKIKDCARYLGKYLKSVPILNRIKIDSDFCRFLGIYIAEGCMSNNCVDICQKDKKILEIYAEPFLKKLGIGYKYRKNNNAWHIYFGSKLFSTFISILVGEKSSDRHLPLFWDRLSDDNLIELIRAYWIGDGTVFIHDVKDNPYKNYSSIVGCSSTSKRLVNEIKFVLTKFNILCSICPKKTQKITHKDQYTLNVLSYFVENFGKTFKFKTISSTRKMRKYFRVYKTFFWVKVKKINEQNYEGKVYNLETENNKYNSNGIIIHNCERAKKNGLEIYMHYDYPCMHFVELELNEVVRAFKGLYGDKR